MATRVDGPNDRQLLFLHVPKTAGTTVHYYLAGRFGRGDSLWLKSIDAIRDATPSTLAPYRFVHGHVGYDFVRKFPRRPALFTFLRDPIDRALSMYHFYRSFPPGHPSLDSSPPALRRVYDLTLPEFIEAEPLVAQSSFGNVQTLYLTSWEQPDSDLGLDLALAKERLAACEFVGLTEKMDDSFALMSYEFGWPPVEQVPHANRTSTRTDRGAPDPEVVKALEPITRLDRELYEFGRGLFERRYRGMLDDFLWDNARPGAVRREDLPDWAEVTFDRHPDGVGWYRPEVIDGQRRCWVSDRASLTLPVEVTGDMLLRVEFAHALDPAVLDTLRITVNDNPLKCLIRSGDWPALVEAVVPEADARSRAGRVRLEFFVPGACRACDLDPAVTDKRVLGLAVSRVTLTPAAAARAA